MDSKDQSKTTSKPVNFPRNGESPLDKFWREHCHDTRKKDNNYFRKLKRMRDDYV